MASREGRAGRACSTGSASRLVAQVGLVWLVV